MFFLSYPIFEIKLFYKTGSTNQPELTTEILKPINVLGFLLATARTRSILAVV